MISEVSYISHGGTLKSSKSIDNFNIETHSGLGIFPFNPFLETFIFLVKPP